MAPREFPSQPPPRHLEEICYDSDRQVLLLFGGVEQANNGWLEPATIYEWNGSKWIKKDRKGPAGRRGHGWVYDPIQKAAVLMGGVMNGVVDRDSMVFDVWNWNGVQWNQMATVCPVKEPEVVYDPVQQRVLVYGAAAGGTATHTTAPAAMELWEYKQERWQRLSSNGPDIQASRMITFDARRNSLVVPVFEEKKLIVWEWTGNKWEQHESDMHQPAYRTRFAFIYDPLQKKNVLFGGLSSDRKQLGDQWQWDGLRWAPVDNTHAPLARNSAHFAAGNDELFLYGGSVPKPAPQQGIVLSNELWSYKNGIWKEVKVD